MSKIIALASFSKGSINFPVDVRKVLGITETKGKVVFIEENGKVYLQKA